MEVLIDDEAFSNALQNKADKLPEELKNLVNTAAFAVDREVKEAAPVITGNLQGATSIDNLSDYGDKLCLLPIGANHESYDLYLMVLDNNSEYYGQVIWVAGEEVERYDDFEKFFNSLIKGNEYVYKLLIGEAEKP